MSSLKELGMPNKVHMLIEGFCLNLPNSGKKKIKPDLSNELLQDEILQPLGGRKSELVQMLMMEDGFRSVKD
jgi:hypothetical protein